MASPSSSPIILTREPSPSGVRRTQSTGDIHEDVARPEPARLRLSHHRSITVSPDLLRGDGIGGPGAPAVGQGAVVSPFTPAIAIATLSGNVDNALHIRLDGLSPEDVAALRRAVDTLTQMREGSDIEALTRALQTVHEIRERGDLRRREQAQPWPRRVLRFLGYGSNNKERKELVNVGFNTSFAFVQFIVIVSLLAYSHQLQSPTEQTKNEWDACGRPLGVWDALWVGRTALSCSIGYWGWRRSRSARARRDAEVSGVSGAERGQLQRPSGTTDPNANVPSPSTDTNPSGNSSSDSSGAEPPYSLLYARLSLLSSLLTAAWFLVAHVYLYSSIDSCRLSSPHLWWLTFGILCILYLLVLEVVAFGIVYLIIFPILVLIWNIVLLCSGRHPYFNPSGIKPEIAKLPRSIVDRIPLVLYIPPPDDEFQAKDSPGPRVPTTAHTYPPDKPHTPGTSSRRRFKFLRLPKKANRGTRRGTSVGGAQEEDEAAEGEIATWEDIWEAGEYPFVRLEGNRAACAVCLMDFEEPKRKPEMLTVLETGRNVATPFISDADTSGTEASSAEIERHTVEHVPVMVPTEREVEELQLEDAGEGAQPLRLLPCGHVFHRTCIDPWLTDVSGRCPVCQRPVKLPEAKDRQPTRPSRLTENPE